jgi:ATP:ADP antiporter, AAA family
MTESDLKDSSATPTRRFQRILDRLIDAKSEELPALGWCWLYIFSVLASYYILRPIRDQMGVAGGVNNLPWLFTGTLVVMLALNVPFSALVKSLPRRQFIPLTYRFFAVTILAFGAVLHWATPEQTIWIGRFFFIWTSVFNLFVVSIFWALVVDIFSSEQGKRLFGFIAAGATLGAIVGSGVTALLAQSVSTPFLLLGAAALLEVAILCVRRLSRLSAKMGEHPHPERDEAPIGGKVMAGFIKTMRSPARLASAAARAARGVFRDFLVTERREISNSTLQYNLSPHRIPAASRRAGVQCTRLKYGMVLTWQRQKQSTRTC